MLGRRRDGRLKAGGLRRGCDEDGPGKQVWIGIATGALRVRRGWMPAASIPLRHFDHDEKRGQHGGRGACRSHRPRAPDPRASPGLRGGPTKTCPEGASGGGKRSRAWPSHQGSEDARVKQPRAHPGRSGTAWAGRRFIDEQEAAGRPARPLRALRFSREDPAERASRRETGSGAPRQQQRMTGSGQRAQRHDPGTCGSQQEAGGALRPPVADADGGCRPGCDPDCFEAEGHSYHSSEEGFRHAPQPREKPLNQQEREAGGQEQSRRNRQPGSREAASVQRLFKFTLEQHGALLRVSALTQTV